MKFKLFGQKKETLLAIIFSLLFLFINIETFMLQNKLLLSIKEVALALVISLIFTLPLAEITIRVKGFIERKSAKALKNEAFKFTVSKSDGIYYMTAAIIIFICWLPVWLAFYPGLFAYDVITQIYQYRAMDFSTHHPLLHTLVLGFFYETLGGKILKDYTLGIALAALFQMIFWSLQLSFVHLFLRRLGVNKLVRGLLIAFCGICPFFSVLAISMTKDVIFSGYLGMLMVSLAYFEIDYDFAVKRKGITALFILSFIGTSVMRSNGRYALWLMTAVVVIKCLIQKKNKLIMGLLISLLLSETLLAALKTGLKAGSPDPNEALSIPIQQMAMVYEANYETMPVEDRQIIETLIPEVINYNRIISDPVKFTTQYVDNRELFWKTYFKLFKEHPRQYIEAFLQNNLGFLCIGDRTNATVYGSGYDRRRGFLMTYTRDGYGIEPVSRFPFLEDLYLKLYCQNDYQNNIFTFLPCSMGLYFWLIVLALFWMIDKKSACTGGGVLILALGATTLLGPCAIIRYMLPYVVALPVLWAMVFHAPNKLTKEEK